MGQLNESTAQVQAKLDQVADPVIYIKGNAVTEGSVRLVVNVAGGFSAVEILSSGIWETYSLKADIIDENVVKYDDDGNLRSSVLIIAEGGIDMLKSLIINDGLEFESSGPSAIFKSKITGNRYETVYQQIDKSGSSTPFLLVSGAEAKDIRQPTFDTQLTSPLEIITTAPHNEILNALYFRTDGDLINFRFQFKSVATGNVILSYPDKHCFDRDEGVNIIGSGEQKINLFYVDKSSPTRVLSGEQFNVVAKWDDVASPGAILGLALVAPEVISGGGFPYYGVDEQIFEFKDVALSDDLTPSGDLGTFIDEAALIAKYPSANDGDYATVVQPNNTLFFWNESAIPDPKWEDSTIPSGGDMNKAIYDPTGKATDAFLMSNMVETALTKIFLNTERAKLQGIEEGAEKNKAGNLILGANEALYVGSNPASASSRNNHPIINFDDTIVETAAFCSKVQTKYQGEDISIDIDWVAETAIVGDVVWGVEFERNAVGGNDIDSDSFAAQQTSTSTTSGTSGVIARTNITITRAEADNIDSGDYFRMRIQRVANNGSDTMIGDAHILRINLRV